MVVRLGDLGATLIIVLDTNVILGDPMCSGDAWGVLAHAAEAWDLEVFVPGVVLLEAIGGFQRRLAELSIAFDGFADKKRFRAMGLLSGVEDMQMAIHEASEMYSDRLKQILLDFDAKILPLPDVPHSVLVERAVSRRKPCDTHGDGYRDTLIWLTIMQILKDHAGDVIFVSNNTKDFGSDVEAESGVLCLHKDLLDELEAAGFAGRLTYAAELRDVVSDLAARLAPNLPQEMRYLKDHLQSQVLSQFVAQSVLPGIAPTSLDPRRCALPVETASAQLLAVGRLTEFHAEIRGGAGNDAAVVDFSVSGESGVAMTLPPTFADDPAVSRLPDGSGVEIQVSKTLVYRGYLTTNSIGKPLAGEIRRISSTADDPGRIPWQEKDAREELRRSSSHAIGVGPRVLENLVPAMKLYESMLPKVDPKMFENLVPAMKLYESMLPKVDPKMFENLLPAMKLYEGLLPSTKLYESMLSKVDPELLGTLMKTPSAQDPDGAPTDDPPGVAESKEGPHSSRTAADPDSELSDAGAGPEPTSSDRVESSQGLDTDPNEADRDGDEEH
ncbi:PIN domain-containing protein [Kribbella sp. NPDC051952]|uniref:PIN domain-containing protein n=1 Tax=Kribbella sp. NPDC051952 TaxID=3154851 RepID=UPI00343DFEAC